MNQQELVELYGLRGSIAAQRDVAKIGLQSCRESAQFNVTPQGKVWLISKMRQYASQARACQRLYRAITRIIKGAEDAKQETNFPF